MARLLRMVFASFLLAVPVLGFAASTIDLNAADAAELAQALNGVGMAKAQAIVEYRAANGPFRSVDDLVNVKGIGPALVDRNRSLMTLGSRSR